jgi:NitT/TauT family transport system ATP-binding protein
MLAMNAGRSDRVVGPPETAAGSVTQPQRALSGENAADFAIRINGVTHCFDAQKGRQITAIRDVTIEMPAQGLTAVVGPSGCGKSTLLNLISGLITPTEGRVIVKGQEVTGVRSDVGYMPARDALLPWRTVTGNVEFALEMQGMLSPKSRADQARQMIEAVGLSGFENYFPHALSHGMRQRTAIARTFVTNPDIMLLDEPFSALDAQTRVHIQDLFLSMWERDRRTVLLITHDVMEAVALADRVVVFSSAPGRVKAVYDIDIARPRVVETLLFNEPRFRGYMKQIWSDLANNNEER